jgi:ribosomal-protein-alanine N-acetyltransferase
MDTVMSTKDINKAYPKIETRRLVLRALRMKDASFIYKEWGNPLVTYYMRDEEPLRSLKQAKEMLHPLQTPEVMPNFKWWGIEFKESKLLIGTCGYCRWDKAHHRAEIGYDLWPDYWGKGIMPEAISALVCFGFNKMGINRIEATTHTENQRSQRVLEKLGFQREGILREYYYRDGTYNNQVQFSFLQSEWLNICEND